MSIKFTKMHGAGNDYIYIDATNTCPDNLPELARKMSDRHKGVGSDGLVAIMSSEIADFRMRMFNADGSEGEMCGNASRCIAKFVYDKGLTTRTTITLETLAGIKILQITKFNPDGTVQEVTVDIDDVKINDIFIVKPGEAIPVDGVIVEGNTAIDESALTGESIPVDKTVGDSVSAATINQSGYVRARASRVGEDTTFANVIKMVSDAAATKAPIARIADRVSGVFVPTVIGIAIVVFIIWMINGSDIAYALERAISVLVISCPCALGLATPVAIMVGNGMGARNGILFKTSEALENAGRIQIVALDKTGTITEPGMHVYETEVLEGLDQEKTKSIIGEGVSKEELLSLAYALEIKSEHPLAKAIVAAAYEAPAATLSITNWRALAGSGIAAEQNGEKLYAGSGKFIRTVTEVPSAMADEESRLADQGKTPLYFVRAGKIIGMIAVADVIKEDSAEAVRQLKRMGINVVMLTGDNERTAKAVGKKAGVDEVIAGVLPDGKEAVIRELQKQGRVAMVGDGINDAPALTRADTGIAIGAGADVALDSADIILMNSKLIDVAAAIRLSRATLKNIHENLFWAFAYNVLLIPVAAGLYSFIHMNPMWSAAAMSLSSFTVCMNALRLNLFKVHSDRRDRKMKKSVDLNMDLFEIEQPKMQKEVCIAVEGMMCEHCEATVRKALEKLDGVESAVASHENGTVILSLSKDFDEEAVKGAIEEEGYEYKGLKFPL